MPELHPCRCGCPNLTRATWYRGHDEMVRTAVMYALAKDTERLAEIFGFGPGLRDATAFVRDARRAGHLHALAEQVAVLQSQVEAS